MPPTVSGHNPVRTPPSVVQCSGTPQSATPATGTPSTRESVRDSSTELYKEYQQHKQRLQKELEKQVDCVWMGMCV